MEYSKNFNFALPSRDNDVDLADINEIANNFRKVDEKSVIKEEGKGLSTNDFTNEEKERLANALLPENIDQTYFATSKNAQSGIAVAEAIEIAKEELSSSISTNDNDGIKVENLFNFSPNLYDESTNILNTVVDKTTGELTTSTNITTTNYIYLEKGSYIMTYELVNTPYKAFTYMAKYGIDKSFKGRTEVKSGTFEITEEDGCYVRFSGSSARVLGIMLNKGTELLPYEPYWVKLKPDNMYDITNDKIADGTITKEKTNFFKTSSNLINRITVEKGYVISTTGRKTANNGYSITDKLLLKPNTDYACKDCFRISYFDKEDRFVKNLSLNNNEQVFTSPSSFSYAIVSLQHDTNTVKRYWQLNEGSVLLPYEPQHLIIDGYKIYDKPDFEVDPIKKFQLKDRIVFDKSPLFVLDVEVDGVNKDTDKSSSVVYGRYDALMQDNPLYITKTNIGTDPDGKILYRYDFKNPNTHHEHEGYSTDKPKVILVSGVHPELSGIYSLYHTMEQITNNPKLQHLKNEVHFIVIPLVNLYGIDNGGRTNKNGVDLARNFEVDWGTNPTDTVQGGETWGGTAPLSELESQAIDRVLQDNTDAICFTSCHSFQGTEGATEFIWGALATKYYTNLGDKLMIKLSQEWKNKHDFISTSDGYINGGINKYIGFVDRNAPAGSEGKQATKYGIHGGTLEVCDYFHFPEYRSHHLDSFVISRGTETYINWILLNVYNYDSNF